MTQHNSMEALPSLLVVHRWPVLWVEVDCLLYQLVTLIFKLLSHSNLASVETLPIVTVDWLGGGRPGCVCGRERLGGGGGERQNIIPAGEKEWMYTSNKAEINIHL